MQKRTFLSAFLAAVLLAFTALSAGAAGTDKVDIPYKKFVLDNGLTLIVHEDHKAPIVAFNVWYHVGSKNEKPGKTGFAHLFEHLMFNGSENYNDDYFKPLQKIGATDLNGTTNEDRTNYFENVPTSALDLILWMESDRMGHLKGAVDQARLDEQRGVVQNELRQSLNEPYGLTEEMIAKASFPAGHPYSWTVIGSLEDLDNAKLDDVHKWFATYYGPNNAVVAIAGDIDAETALKKVQEYFGDIPPSPPIGRNEAWIAKRTGIHRESVEDRVSQDRIYMIWNVPQWGTAENGHLDLASDVLSDGKTSRLYKRLVYDDQTATSVYAWVDSREIAGLFYIRADVKPGVDPAVVEKAINEELAEFLSKGPTEKELERVKTQSFARFVKGIERIGGFGGKSDILARCQTFGGTPDFYKTLLKHKSEATVQDLKNTSAKWLSDGVYILQVHPYPRLAAGKSDVDRTKLPGVGAPPEVKFPVFQRDSLANGLNIILAENHSVPVVKFSLLLDAGFAADVHGTPGTSTLAMNMLDEGTARRTALQISEELALLGGDLRAGSNLDTSFVSLTALKDKLDPTLDIYADVILNPSFPQADFERQQKLQIARISQEKDSPFGIAFRVFPLVVFGKGHAYGSPFTGSGFENSLAKLTRQDLVAFHREWFKPNHATLIVVGDTSLDEIKPKLEKLFHAWKSGDIPEKAAAPVAAKGKSAVYILDKPEAPQSLIIGGHVAPPYSDPDNVAIDTMNFILGGDFVSRINLNIREDKHWSYGANSFIVDARGQRPFVVLAPVQSDKTKETMSEIKNEIEGILGKRPITPDEYANAKSSKVLQLPGQWETMSSVISSLSEIVQYGLPDDYFRKYPAMVRNLSLEDLGHAAKKVLRPDEIQWIVVGDRAQIEPKIRELGYTEIFIIDGDGNIISPKH